jgi:pyruvate,water dikinase
MKWIKDLFGKSELDSDRSLDIIQARFNNFLEVLHHNNIVLKNISDMEEKLQGEYLFDLNYIRSRVSEIRKGVAAIVNNMISLGGEKYKKLKECYDKVDARISRILPGGRPIEEDDYTRSFDSILRENAYSVGSKNAQLGEMKSRLGLPVPDGFAITAWAYKRFIDFNSLQHQISDLIRSLNIRSYEDLQNVSRQIQAMVTEAAMPDDLALEITQSYKKLREKNPRARFALRSSAIGEDTEFSFAGQYRSVLNVRAAELLESYREVLASKFTPQAIYYFMSHSLSEDELAMCVGCIVMVNARSSGVVYTRDPVDPGEDNVIINSIFGLGKYLVDGAISPDIIRVSRTSPSIQESITALKTRRLEMHPDGGTIDSVLPYETGHLPSISESEAVRLAEIAMKIEEHYGGPQDIEWAIDHNGQIYILQTRPLRVIAAPATRAEVDVSGYEILAEGGHTICPGAGGGAVHRISSAGELRNVPSGVILVTPHSFPGIVTVMGKINGLIAETGGMASHMATIAREYGVPAIGGLKNTENLINGEPVTLDSTASVIYRGYHQDLIEKRKPEQDLFEDLDIYNILKQIAGHIAPLHLINPQDAEFIPEKCASFHDITRYSHQKAMAEMFYGASELKNKDRYSSRLKTVIPLAVNIIYVDREIPSSAKNRVVDDKKIDSEPMSAFWSGVLSEGWPAPPRPADMKGLFGVFTTNLTRGEEERFSEKSFAILSKEYMILSLRMGYHFSTIEAMVTPEENKNYIRMEFKDGGATIERRIRRIKLLTDILSLAGFENFSKGDFLDARMSYQDAESTVRALYLLGRLTVMTKQLDMALSNDAIARWYTNDILKKLGMPARGEEK